MTNYVENSKSHFRKRITIFEMKQNMEENVKDWFIRVKNTGTQCKFGNMSEEQVKNKFVTGMVKIPNLDRLCEEPTLNLQELLDVALKKESSRRQSSGVSSVNKIRSYNKSIRKDTPAEEDLRKSTKMSQAEAPLCFACGKEQHNFRICRYKMF